MAVKLSPTASPVVLPWATATGYKTGQTVTNSGQTYTATSDHTSGATFAGDLTGGKWSALPITLLTSLGGPNYKITPSTLATWRKALSKVRIGTGDAKVLVAGDSTSVGVGAGEAATKSWPALLKSLLNSYYVPASLGLNVLSGSGTTDTRWTLGTGWSLSTNYGFAQQVINGASGAAGNLTFAPGYACDTADIYFVRATGSGIGTGSVSTDGGSATTLPGNVANSVGKVTVSLGSLASNHVMTFTGPSGGVMYLIGIDCYDSTTRRVRLGISGVSGTTTAQWARSSQPFETIGCIGAYAPDLTICMLGINDSVSGSPVSQATYITNMTAVINAAKASGDVIIATIIPSSSSARDLTAQASYTAAAYTLADSLNCGVVDINARYVDYTTALAAGYMNDTVHCKDFGYSDIAQAIFNTLKTV